MHKQMGCPPWDAAERTERNYSVRLSQDLLERGEPPTYMAKIMPFQVASDAGTRVAQCGLCCVGRASLLSGL